jgi:hypothetical protein
MDCVFDLGRNRGLFQLPGRRRHCHQLSRCGVSGAAGASETLLQHGQPGDQRAVVAFALDAGGFYAASI